MEKIPLDSPRWEELDGSSVQVPILISRVMSDVNLDSSDDLRELADYMIHQFSCREVTYAVVPYIAEKISRSDLNKSLSALHLLGTIGAVHDIEIDRLSDRGLIPPFIEALSIAERSCIKAILLGGWSLEQLYDLLVASFGASGHPLGKLVMDSMVAYQEAESSAECPQCGEQIDVVVSNDGMRVLDNTNSIVGTIRSMPSSIVDTENFHIPSRNDNTWTAIGKRLQQHLETGEHDEFTIQHLRLSISLSFAGVCRASDIRAAFSLFGSLLSLYNFDAQGRRYFHALDMISCSNCGSSFIFAENWWGVKAPSVNTCWSYAPVDSDPCNS